MPCLDRCLFSRATRHAHGVAADVAADGRYRLRRVVDKAVTVCRSQLRGIGGQDAVSRSRVGTSVARHEVFHLLGAGQREVVPAGPEAASGRAAVRRHHHVDSGIGFLVGAAVDALEVQVEEALLDQRIGLCVRAERRCAGVGRMPIRVPHEFRTASGRGGAGAHTHTLVAPDRSHVEKIVRGTRHQSRDLDVRIVGLDVHLLPVVVVVRMRQPFVEVGLVCLELRDAGQRQRGRPGRHVVQRSVPCRHLRIDLCLWRSCRLACANDLVRPEPRGDPADIEPGAEDPVHIGPVVVIVGPRDRGRYRREVRWTFDRCLPLRESQIGATRHADLARGPRLRSCPFHGVVAVVRFLRHQAELSLRGDGAPHGLRDHRVPMRHQAQAAKNRHRPAEAAASIRTACIGVAHQDHRQLASLAFRPVDLRRELDAIAHGDHHLFAGDLRILFRRVQCGRWVGRRIGRRSGRRRQKQEGRRGGAAAPAASPEEQGSACREKAACGA
ncbi:hypothetical protein D3C86_1217730 [compost metagenome]